VIRKNGGASKRLALSQLFCVEMYGVAGSRYVGWVALEASVGSQLRPTIVRNSLTQRIVDEVEEKKVFSSD
jgi:hypothetical protein